MKTERRIKIGVIGTADQNAETDDLAYQAGMEIASRNCILVCGGLGGVMESACSGAKHNGGITVGIIPGSRDNEANDYVDIPVITNMGEARNVIVVRSSGAVIAIGGGFGTLSEISFALKLGIPVIGLGTWTVSDEIVIASNPAEAAEIAYDKAASRTGRKI